MGLHSLQFGFVGLHFLLFWPFGPSFPFILAFSGSASGPPPPQVTKNGPFAQRPYNGFISARTGSILQFLAFWASQGNRILVHPIRVGLDVFLPVSYAYATTMRRAQGSTLELAALWFDRLVPDRGYAYVGASRARRQADLYHVGKVRRTDWLPVGVDPLGHEQLEPSVWSQPSSHEGPESSDLDDSGQSSEGDGDTDVSDDGSADGSSDLSGDFGLRRDGFGAAVEDAGDAEEAEEVQSDAAGLLAL